MGKRIIYVATDNVGFEVNGFPQEFVSRKLFNRVLNTDSEVEYIAITELKEGNIVPSVALKLLERFYVFNSETNSIEEHDIVDEGLPIIQVDIQNVIRLDKNTYIRKFAFDCIPVGITNENNAGPLTGMRIEEQTKVLKTHNFQCESSEKSLQPDDLIVYENQLYIIQDVQVHYWFSPRKQRVLEFSMVKVR